MEATSVAISERRDIWQAVQRRAWEGAGAHARLSVVEPIPFPHRPTIQIDADRPAWHSDRFKDRADAAFVRMERALAKGRFAKAAKLRAAWMASVHADRLARARSASRDTGLRLDPMGRGPIPELRTLHYRDRLPWRLNPVRAYDHDDLPDRASSVIDAWNAQGDVFDSYVVADEPPGTAPFPTHCLVGAISADGRTADWFILDRWAS
jgi:hypothetical protein